MEEKIALILDGMEDIKFHCDMRYCDREDCKKQVGDLIRRHLWGYPDIEDQYIKINRTEARVKAQMEEWRKGKEEITIPQWYALSKDKYTSPLPIHPGKTISDEMKARWWSVDWTSQKLEIKKQHLANIIEWKVEITEKMAHKLEWTFWLSAQFWLNLEQFYQDSLKVQEHDRLYKSKAKQGTLLYYWNNILELRKVTDDSIEVELDGHWFLWIRERYPLNLNEAKIILEHQIPQDIFYEYADMRTWNCRSPRIEKKISEDENFLLISLADFYIFTLNG